MAEQTPPTTPAGWYPDPKIAGILRYWDGEKWTDDAAPISTPPAPAIIVPRAGISTSKGIAIVALGILAAAAVLIFVQQASKPSDFDCSIQRVEVATGDRAAWDVDEGCE